jgi:hypothetical protein
MPLVVLDGNLVSRTLKTSTDGSDLVVHHNVDTVASAVAATQSGGWTVSITGTVPAVTPGTGSTNLGKAEDAAHTTGDVGVMSLAVRNDAGTALAGTTGDYIPITTDAGGNVRAVSLTNGDGIVVGGSSLVVKSKGEFVASAATDTVFVAAVTSKKIRVLAFAVIGFEKNHKFEMTFRTKPAGAGTKISASINGTERGNVVLPFNPYGWFETNAGEGLSVSTGSDTGVDIQLSYMEV